MSARAVSIDVRWMSSGAGTYAFNLLKNLKRCDPSIDLHAISAARDRQKVAPYCDRVSVVDADIYSVREQFAVASATTRSTPLHATHYNASLLHRGPLLVTIPDVTPLLADKYCATWKSRFYGKPMLRAIARRADHVFTVSAYSQQQLSRHLDLPAGKITVAHNGVADEFRPMDAEEAAAIVRRDFGIDTPFLLYVGNFRPHKNVAGLLRAFHSLRERHRDHRLLLIGADGMQLGQLNKQARDLGIAETALFAQHATQPALIAAYCAADALVLPSFEEGFGLPVVEAMACGTPVVCSNASSLPEIAGDAAEYFDPNDVEQMADAISRVVSDRDLHGSLRARGLARAAQFTWAKSAQIHVDVYRRFLA
jgi:glycosyltransferase involved in cell wall biosynthesis